MTHATLSAIQGSVAWIRRARAQQEIVRDGHMSDDAKKPSQKRLDTLPTEGYGLQVDGKIKSQYATSEAAMKAALDIKKRFPVVQVVVFDAAARTRTPVELPQETTES
jgi:hypothetical protein